MRRVHGAAWIICCLTLVLAGCSREPFTMVPVSGKVTYEDGSVIPAELLCVIFTPQSPPVDAKTYPRPGSAPVDAATGELRSVTTHKFNDGLASGKHKVTFGKLGGGTPPATLIPAEYLDPAKTPLEVDTANPHFDLRIRKPK
jgi:hypothetical protein